MLDLAVADCQLDTILVLSAHRTLIAEDTGMLFWKDVSERNPRFEKNTLCDVFDGPLRHTYLGFRQAALLHEEISGGNRHHALLCERVARLVTMHPELVNLLRRAKGKSHVGVVILTSGPRRVWKILLKDCGLWSSGDRIGVIGEEGYIVTPAVKAALVSRLRNVHHKYVWAFGGSGMDVEMLKQVDQAIVVVGEEDARSKSIDRHLKDAIDNKGLRARQVLLPSNSSPRLDTTRLLTVQLTNEFIESIFRRRKPAGVKLLHAADKPAAKLLMTSMRDAANSGPVLREAHRRAGSYLATGFVADVIGLEEYDIQHVRGYQTVGHRLLQEEQTTIVALMRGGEPMALSVSETFSPRRIRSRPGAR